MRNSAAILFNGTIGKVGSISIQRGNNLQEIRIRVHPTINMYSLIQGVCLKLTYRKKTVLEAGIATLLSRTGIAISEAVLSSRETNILIIPLIENYPNVCRIKLYTGLNGRVLSREFIPQ